MGKGVVQSIFNSYLFGTITKLDSRWKQNIMTKIMTKISQFFFFFFFFSFFPRQIWEG